MRNAALLASHDVKTRRVPRSFANAPLDIWLFTAVAALVAIGLVMVFSASSATAYADHGDVAYYVKRQFAWLVVGLAGAFFLYRLDYTRLRSIAPWLLVGAVVGLLLVFVPHIGFGVSPRSTAPKRSAPTRRGVDRRRADRHQPLARCLRAGRTVRSGQRRRPVRRAAVRSADAGRARRARRSRRRSGADLGALAGLAPSNFRPLTIPGRL